MGSQVSQLSTRDCVQSRLARARPKGVRRCRYIVYRHTYSQCSFKNDGRHSFSPHPLHRIEGEPQSAPPVRKGSSVVGSPTGGSRPHPRATRSRPRPPHQQPTPPPCSPARRPPPSQPSPPLKALLSERLGGKRGRGGHGGGQLGHVAALPLRQAALAAAALAAEGLQGGLRGRRQGGGG